MRPWIHYYFFEVYWIHFCSLYCLSQCPARNRCSVNIFWINEYPSSIHQLPTELTSHSAILILKFVHAFLILLIKYYYILYIIFPIRLWVSQGYSLCFIHLFIPKPNKVLGTGNFIIQWMFINENVFKVQLTNGKFYRYKNLNWNHQQMLLIKLHVKWEVIWYLFAWKRVVWEICKLCIIKNTLSADG